jgi:hypothetical protein
MRNRLAILLLILLSISFNSQAQFQEGVDVIHSFSGFGANFGWAVSELDDINNDGVTDIIIGATGSHQTVVYSGKDGALIYTFREANSQIGYSVADAGDVDNDGVNDIIVGGPVKNNATGIAIVFSGASGAKIWSLNGEAIGDRFGSSVSSAGDVDQDGYSDFMVGAEDNSSQGVNSGKAYVYSGKNAVLIRSYASESAADKFGGGIAALGDLNNDGVLEHIVGAYNANNSGKAYVYSGANGELLFDLAAEAGGAQFGQFFVANSGDVDKDGVDDIYVGDYSHSSGAGRVYINPAT